MASTTTLLRLTAAVIFIIIGTCISDTRFVTTVAGEFSFPDHYCSPLRIEEYEGGMRKARDHILIDLLKKHYSPEHRSEHFTCIRATVDGNTMWAQADCREPTSNFCIGCLVYATSYLDSKCLYFSGGRVTETTETCSMKFGDFDVCASQSVG